MANWFKIEPPGDIIKRSFHEKTVNLSITLPADMLQQVTNWGIQHGIVSRSMAIQWFILQGVTRIREMETEMRIAEEEHRKEDRVAELKWKRAQELEKKKKGELTETEKDELKALDHVYDVDEE